MQRNVALMPEMREFPILGKRPEPEYSAFDEYLPEPVQEEPLTWSNPPKRSKKDELLDLMKFDLKKKDQPVQKMSLRPNGPLDNPLMRVSSAMSNSSRSRAPQWHESS